MREKRNYDRIKIKVSVLVFVDDCDGEISGEVTDISEDSIGLKFRVSDEQKQELMKKGVIKFQFVDSYRDGSKNKTDIIQACGLIKRISFAGLDDCIVGCLVRDESYKKYVFRREISGFFE